MSSIFTFGSTEEFDAFVLDKKNKDKLILVNFTAQWCGPCKRFAPKLELLADEYRDVARFIKIDIDELTDLAVDRYKISAVPAFMFIDNNEIVEQFVGPDEQKIRSIFRSWLYKSLQQQSSKSKATGALK
jgi:thioredoxin 1